MSEDFPGILARADKVCDEAAVSAALDRMAGEIRSDLSARDPLVLVVMIGGMVPAVWLLERLDFPHQVDYVHASRYRGATQGSASLEWRARPPGAVAGRDVLVIDDILDEGFTLAAIMEACRAQGAASVRSAVLVKKAHGRCVPGLVPDYVGVEVEDRYVFGCGMDYHERYRQLPAVYALAVEDAS